MSEKNPSENPYLKQVAEDEVGLEELLEMAGRKEVAETSAREARRSAGMDGARTAWHTSSEEDRSAINF